MSEELQVWLSVDPDGTAKIGIKKPRVSLFGVEANEWSWLYERGSGRCFDTCIPEDEVLHGVRHGQCREFRLIPVDEDRTPDVEDRDDGAKGVELDQDVTADLLRFLVDEYRASQDAEKFHWFNTLLGQLKEEALKGRYVCEVTIPLFYNRWALSELVSRGFRVTEKPMCECVISWGSPFEGLPLEPDNETDNREPGA